MYGREEKHVEDFGDETYRIEITMLTGMLGRDDGNIKKDCK
jgi:hypothetical protein